jgi:hypothetical protein
LPLHESQNETEIRDDHSVFEYNLIPNFYFKKELFSYMNAVEVLEPEWLRDEMKEQIINTLNEYE